jgi:hypothetical protein
MLMLMDAMLLWAPVAVALPAVFAPLKYTVWSTSVTP